ncbi:MAG: hypothetical protein R6V85_19905 [Polyangia bacterium]
MGELPGARRWRWVLSWLLLAAPACDEPGDVPGGGDPDVEAVAAAEIGTAAEQGTDLDSAEGTGLDEVGAVEEARGASEPVSDSFSAFQSAVDHAAMTRMAPEEKQSSWAEGVYVRDECCTEPGQAAECWEQDADDDGVTCEVNADCPSGSCDTSTVPGLCECGDDDECNDGVCTDAGVCGPSWCNGYKICSCWGGCVWWHADDAYTPEDMCEAQDLYCCNDGYTADPTASGFCSTSVSCGEGECDTSADCTAQVGNVCVQPLCMDEMCYYPAVNAGNCVDVENPGVTWGDQSPPCCCNVDADCPTLPCVDSMYCDTDPTSSTYHQCIFDWVPVMGDCEGEGADPTDTNDACGWWQCDANHDCYETYAAVGTECPPFPQVNTTCRWWECDGGGNCIEHTAAAGADCAPAGETSTICEHWECDGAGSCVQTIEPGGTPCPPAGETNDTCQEWLCDGGGTCLEHTHVGANCDVDHGGPSTEGSDYCGTWRCQADYSCQKEAEHTGQVCQANVDKCAERRCEAAYCTGYTLDVGDECFTPSGGYDACRYYECSVAHECVDAGPAYVPGMSWDLETCSIEAADTVNSPDSVEGDNACSVDHYNPYNGGRFNSCGVSDAGEAVYHFTDYATSSYQLRHTSISVSPTDVGSGYSDNTNWHPLLYTRTTCETASTQYTCEPTSSATTATVNTGPWPYRDYPNSNAPNGMQQIYTYDMSVFVDSRPTTDPPGGEFLMDLSREAHNNNYCNNTDSWVSAPFISGGNYWKERWRGNTNGYENTWRNLLGGDGPSCWSGGFAGYSDTDPKAALFRIQLPDGSTEMGTYDWDHTYKIYTDHAGIGSNLETTLSLWGLSGAPADDSNGCADDLENQYSCRNGSGTQRPRERIIRSGNAWRNGYVAVANYNPGEQGNYELNVIRSPRPYLSMAKIYVGPADTLSGGCCSGGGSHPYEKTMDLEGYRLDFVPTNDTVRGYYVDSSVPTSVELSNGWLVNPSTGVGGDKLEHQVIPTCNGSDGNTCRQNRTSRHPKDVGFSVPIAGDFYRYYCINQAGFVALRKDPGVDCPRWDAEPDTAKLTRPYELGPPGLAPLLAPLWGNLVPCFRSNRECSYDPGWNSCELYQHKNCKSSSGAIITTDLVRFEGTTARVITFNGMDSVLEPRSSNSRDNSLQFQVIIRVDGRIIFFYKEPVSSSAWDQILDVSGWMIGLSGSLYHPCSGDGDCDAAFGASANVECDDQDYSESGETIYSAGDHCIKRISDYKDDNVTGVWIGGP